MFGLLMLQLFDGGDCIHVCHLLMTVPLHFLQLFHSLVPVLLQINYIFYYYMQLYCIIFYLEVINYSIQTLIHLSVIFYVVIFILVLIDRNNYIYTYQYQLG